MQEKLQKNGIYPYDLFKGTESRDGLKEQEKLVFHGKFLLMRQSRKIPGGKGKIRPFTENQHFEIL